MKNKFMKITVLLLSSLFFYTGCLFNTKTKFDTIPDRKFYFSEFQFILLKQDKEESFSFFQSFPVKKIMFMLAREYNITVDISEFNDFINKKNLSVIETSGMFRNVKNTWKTGRIENNRISFIFNQDYLDESIIKFKVVINSGNSILQSYEMDIEKKDEIFTKLEYYLKSGKESLSEYNSKNYANTSPIPLIIEGSINSSDAVDSNNLQKIKNMIDEYIKGLNQNDKDKFKHEIIDYIYQKCN